MIHYVSVIKQITLGPCFGSFQDTNAHTVLKTNIMTGVSIRQIGVLANMKNYISLTKKYRIEIMKIGLTSCEECEHRAIVYFS